MQAPKQQSTTSNLVVLPTDLLVLILMYLGDPICLGRLMQVSRALRQNLTGEKSNVLWRFYVESKYPRFTITERVYLKKVYPRLTISGHNYDFKLIYRTLSDERAKVGRVDVSYRRLFNLIRIGDLQRIKEGKNLPDMTSDHFLYQLNDEYHNPVSLAVRFNRQEILTFFYELVCKNVFVKQKLDSIKRTQLHWAAACNQLSAVKELLQLPDSVDGSDARSRLLSATDINELTPLHIAARYGHFDIVSALLAAGANFDAVDYQGITPLCNAAEEGHAVVVRYLIAAGADFNTAVDSQTPLYRAARKGHVAVIRELIAVGAEFNTPQREGQTPLYIAAQEGQAGVVRVLIAAGANVSTACDNGQTPLYIAALNGRADVVKALVQAGVDFNTAGSKGQTLVHIAAEEGYADVVRALSEAGANVNTAADKGQTPLCVAIQYGHADVVRALIAVGADVNLASDGSSPLYRAVQYGDIDTVKALLAAGANANFIWRGQSVLEIAKEKKHSSICIILRLWEVYEKQKDKPLSQQLIALLNTPTCISYDVNYSYFFSSPEDKQCHQVVKDLRKQVNDMENGEKTSAFCELLESKQSIIPTLKYEFIMDLVLAPKPMASSEFNNSCNRKNLTI